MLCERRDSTDDGRPRAELMDLSDGNDAKNPELSAVAPRAVDESTVSERRVPVPDIGNAGPALEILADNVDYGPADFCGEARRLGEWDAIHRC